MRNRGNLTTMTTLTDTITNLKSEAEQLFGEVDGLTSEEVAWITIAGYNATIRDLVPEEILPAFLTSAGLNMADYCERYKAEREASSA